MKCDWQGKKKREHGKDGHVMDAINERGLHFREASKEGGTYKTGGSDPDAERWRHNA